MLQAFGFFIEWIGWFMSCVSTPPFFVLTNVIPSTIFSTSRGLRQGDFISPYLFLLIIEGLGRLLKQFQVCVILKGWSWAANISSQTHLQFVDDTFLLVLAKFE